MVQFNEEKQEKKLAELHKREAESLAKVLSSKYGLPYVDLSSIPINTDALRLLPEKMAREALIASFQLTGKKLKVAVSAPNSNLTKIALAELEKKGLILTTYLVSKSSLERAWKRYSELSFAMESESGILDISSELLEKVSSEIKNIGDIKIMLEETITGGEKHRISKILEVILAGAISTGSSDIHIEPEKDDVGLRLRLDGVLQDVISFNHKTYDLMDSRIKLLSGLKINVKNEAQDGRLTIKKAGIEIEIRTSILPGAYGESIVMRVLNPENIAVKFEELGIEPHLLSILEKEIKKPNGMILTTGPTGSGKTTTLYAFLRKIHTPGIKIITIEDPIEYHLDGITQTQTNNKKNYTFHQGLRASLRQDPDVIMVGEIRDEETAKVAVDAALTGHLVLSTLHTNNAAGAIPRLIDLGVNPKVISSSVSVSMAQRLIRKLCSFCKKEEVMTPEEKGLVDNVLKTIRDEGKGVHLEGISDNVEKVWKSVGCEKCNNTGYKGRIGVFDAILTDEAVEKIMTQNPNEREIKKAALPQGILDMKQDGIIKVIRGETSLAELQRVVNIEGDL